jgi:hypothetical protein
VALYPWLGYSFWSWCFRGKQEKLRHYSFIQLFSKHFFCTYARVVLSIKDKELKISPPQKKISTESFKNRREQVENRVSGTEDKIKKLDQLVKDHEKF